MEPVSWWSTFGPPATSLTRRLLVYFRSGAYIYSHVLPHMQEVAAEKAQALLMKASVA
jgi:hypothetical protein